MNKTVKTTMVTARKKHQCGYCLGHINKGEKHTADLCVRDTIFTWRSHNYCHELVEQLVDCNYYEDGFDSDGFYEEVKNEWQIHTSLNPQGVAFKDILDYVLNKYQIEKS